LSANPTYQDPLKKGSNLMTRITKILFVCAIWLGFLTGRVVAGTLRGLCPDYGVLGVEALQSVAKEVISTCSRLIVHLKAVHL